MVVHSSEHLQHTFKLGPRELNAKLNASCPTLHNDANLAMPARIDQVYHHLLQVLLKGSMDHLRHELSGHVSTSTNQQPSPMRVLFTLLQLVAATDVTHLGALCICH